MLDRYNEKARRTLFFAREEASAAGDQYIRPEHLMLGLLRESSAVRALLRVDTLKLMKQLRDQSSCGDPVSTSVDMPLDGECTRMLVYAVEEADAIQQEMIGPEHLLLGVLREETSTVSKVLREQGAHSTDIIRQSVTTEVRLRPGE